ncbi:MAG: MFS transporter [Chloroflexi bacterium]|nr:MAG: MFS transporter [Chloroflexota bacterium]
MKRPTQKRWYVIAIFFTFMLLHQTDKLLIGPLTTPIMETFGINEVQMGAVFTGALVVGAVCYPLWGIMYDRYARPKLLAGASFIWGATTWLSAIAPGYGSFLATRATTGIDDSSYPGLYSLVSDYFGPNMRGKIYGFLQLTSPFGYMLGMVLGLLLSGTLGWRNIFYITGILGILLSVIIFFFVKEVPRGQSEPELASLEHISIYRLNWKSVVSLLKKPSLFFLILQGFFGVFPWNVIIYWFFRYLETERGYNSNEVFLTMVIAVVVLAAGYPLGGFLGDALFKRTVRGRVIVSTIGVFTGAVLLYLTMNIPFDNKLLFGIMLTLTAIFIPFASPNVVSTVYDIALPEVRSTAVAVENFLESIGAAMTPLIAGLIAVDRSLHAAIIIICTSTWMLCTVFFIIVAFLIPKDVHNLRQELKARAEAEAAAGHVSIPGAKPVPVPVE